MYPNAPKTLNLKSALPYRMIRLFAFLTAITVKNKPTNVLSFPDWGVDGRYAFRYRDIPIGDIVVAFETVKREALEQNKPFKDHFSHIIIHGFLHLLGYDHILMPSRGNGGS